MDHTKCRKCVRRPAVSGTPYCAKCEGPVIDANIEKMLGRIKKASYPEDIRKATQVLAEGRVFPQFMN